MRAVVVIEVEAEDPDTLTRLVAAVHERGLHKLPGARPVLHVAYADAAERVLDVFPPGPG